MKITVRKMQLQHDVAEGEKMMKKINDLRDLKIEKARQKKPDSGIISQEESFIEACLKGNSCADDIDKYVSYWHTQPMKISLREFLGFTEEEYAQWATSGDDVIEGFLNSRKAI